ncbi:MAG: hypothetical protein ABEH86_00560 [Haloarcula sp.]
MSTNSPDGTDRFPTTGPDTEVYDRFQTVTTAEDVIIYDIECEEAWIQTSNTVCLEGMR